MEEKRVRLFFANLDVMESDDIMNINHAVRVVSSKLEKKYDIKVYAVISSDHYIELLIMIPDTFDDYFDPGRYLRGIATELLRWHNQRYRPKMIQSRLLHFKEIR